MRISTEEAIRKVNEDIKNVPLETLDDLFIASMNNSAIPFDKICEEIKRRNI